MARRTTVEQTEAPPGPDGEAVQFVNHLMVRLSLSDVRFDLSRIGIDDEIPPVWRFSTTPDHLLTMHGGLDLALASYRERYGEIAAVAVDPTDVQFDEGRHDG